MKNYPIYNDDKLAKDGVGAVLLDRVILDFRKFFDLFNNAKRI